MHIHSHGEIIETKENRFKKLKMSLIHLGVSVLILATVPFFLSFITRDQREDIRSKNPQISNQNKLLFYQGRVEQVLGERREDPANERLVFQQLEVKPIEGPESGQLFRLETQINGLDKNSAFEEGDRLILIRSQETDRVQYFLSERYRLDGIFIIALVFISFVILFLGIRGITAIIGLLFSIFVLTNFLVPLILTGQNVVLITFVTGLLIMTISIYLAHGFNKVMTVSLAGSVITITLATLLSIGVVYLAKLTGTGSDEAFQLNYNLSSGTLNFRGLLLSGIIIGFLGVLDDVTTTQASSVSEISQADPTLGFWELYKRANKIGQEHVISVINTLGLAYVSVALPFILYLTIYSNTPLWVSLNSEPIAEEIIRTLVGTVALLLAIPITNLLAAKFLSSKKDSHSKHKAPPKKPESEKAVGFLNFFKQNFTQKAKNISKKEKPVEIELHHHSAKKHHTPDLKPTSEKSVEKEEAKVKHVEKPTTSKKEEKLASEPPKAKAKVEGTEISKGKRVQL